MLFTFRCTVIAVYTFKTRDLHQTKAKIEPRSLVQTVSIFRCKRFCQSRNSVSKRVKVHNLEVAGGTGRVGHSEVDLETFYIARVLALRAGL